MKAGAGPCPHAHRRPVCLRHCGHFVRPRPTGARLFQSSRNRYTSALKAHPKRKCSRSPDWPSPHRSGPQTQAVLSGDKAECSGEEQ